jgi:hypothetical protein
VVPCFNGTDKVIYIFLPLRWCLNCISYYIYQRPYYASRTCVVIKYLIKNKRHDAKVHELEENAQEELNRQPVKKEWANVCFSTTCPAGIFYK